MANPILTLSDEAIHHMHLLLAERGKPSAGIRIGTSTRGCNGMAYTLEYADDIGPYDEIVEVGSLKILIDPKAIMFILGTHVTYQEDIMESGFVFKNPNEKGRCGCGESFHV